MTRIAPSGTLPGMSSMRLSSCLVESRLVRTVLTCLMSGYSAARLVDSEHSFSIESKLRE